MDTAINFVITKTNHVAEGGNVQLKTTRKLGQISIKKSLTKLANHIVFALPIHPTTQYNHSQAVEK